jgi:hypothetical protein
VGLQAVGLRKEVLGPGEAMDRAVQSRVAVSECSSHASCKDARNSPC